MYFNNERGIELNCLCHAFKKKVTLIIEFKVVVTYTHSRREYGRDKQN